MDCCVSGRYICSRCDKYINSRPWVLIYKPQDTLRDSTAWCDHPLSEFCFSQAPVCVICVHYNDVILGAIASQITSLTIVYSTVYSVADQRKHENSASLALWPVNSPHNGPVSRKMFPFDDIIMHFPKDRENLCQVWRSYRNTEMSQIL